MALYQTAARTDGKHSAFQSGSRLVQSGLLCKETLFQDQGHPTGSDGKSCFSVHMGDHEIDGSTGHGACNKTGTFIFRFPQLCFGDQNTDAKRNDDGTVQTSACDITGSLVVNIELVKINTDNGASHNVVASERSINGVPFLPLFRSQIPIQCMEVQREKITSGRCRFCGIASFLWNGGKGGVFFSVRKRLFRSFLHFVNNSPFPVRLFQKCGCRKIFCRSFLQNKTILRTQLHRLLSRDDFCGGCILHDLLRNIGNRGEFSFLSGHVFTSLCRLVVWCKEAVGTVFFPSCKELFVGNWNGRSDLIFSKQND